MIIEIYRVSCLQHIERLINLFHKVYNYDIIKPIWFVYFTWDVTFNVYNTFQTLCFHWCTLGILIYLHFFPMKIGMTIIVCVFSFLLPNFEIFQAACNEEAGQYERAFILELLASANSSNSKEVLCSFCSTLYESWCSNQKEK